MTTPITAAPRRLSVWANWRLVLPSPDSGDDSFLGRLVAGMADAGWTTLTYAECRTNGVVPDAALFLNLPRQPIGRLIADWRGRTRLFAFLMESEAVLARNWDWSRHRDFDVIFTWRGDMADGRRYVWLNYSKMLRPRFHPARVAPDRLCTLVAGNKFSYHPLELYSKRVEAIRWFEAHHPGDFDLYGYDWDRAIIKYPPAFRWLGKRMKFANVLHRPFYTPFPSYRGPVADKLAVLAQYKFSLCFENARDIPDYISEKIFDCFEAGCVPVYLGAPNIGQRIPPACFIDFRDFSDYGRLYAYLKNMPERTYRGYLGSIYDYLNSREADPYRAECAAAIAVRTITAERFFNGPLSLDASGSHVSARESAGRPRIDRTGR